MPTVDSHQKTTMLALFAEKRCIVCGYVGPREKFQRKGAKGDTRHPACVACYPQYRRRWNDREAAAQRKRRDTTTPAVERERRTWLDAAPIRGWLEEKARFMTEDEISLHTGVHEREVFRIRYESQRVNLDTVDRMLVNAGRPDLLRDLYPSLYQFDDMEMAA